MKKKLLPPLRLILTNKCNGKCSFCHEEGSIKTDEMSMECIDECIKAANHLSLPVIALTGGEPTIREDLPHIIREIQTYAPNTEIHLTSNGFNLNRIINEISDPIDCLNLSIFSLNPKLACLYQNVDPNEAISFLKCFPAKKKNINIVITKENYHELEEVINCGIINQLSIDVMFELKRYTKEDHLIQEYVLNFIEELGEAVITLKPTPTIVININESCSIRIKHPVLSALPQVGICSDCYSRTSCFERLCAVRVYPNGIVSPCLDGTHSIDGISVYDKIAVAYSEIEQDYSFLNFLNVESGPKLIADSHNLST